jgi:hypothetical protein
VFSNRLFEQRHIENQAALSEFLARKIVGPDLVLNRVESFRCKSAGS